MVSSDQRRPVLVEYVLATGLIVLSLLVQWLIDAPGEVPSFQCSLLAVALAAFLFSSHVALFVVLVSSLGQSYFFIEPIRTLWISDLTIAVQFTLFIIVSLTLCYVIDRLKHARHANEATLRELIRSNRARQLSDHRLDAGLNSIRDPILLLHPVRDAKGFIYDFLIEYLNEPAAALNPGGASARESQLGQRLSTAAPIHQIHGLLPDYINVVEKGDRLDRELLIDTGDGLNVREVQVRAHRLGDGTVIQWRDVSDYRKAQSTSRLSEGRYHSLVQAIGAIVWTTPASGEFETPQLEWSVFTGQKFEDLRGWGWLDAVHPDDRTDTAARWSAAMANGRSLDIEHRLRRHDGQYRYMQVRAVPIVDNEGKVQEWIGVHSDITDRKQAEEIIADSERQLRRVLNALYTFVGVLTPSGILVGANEAPLRAAGIKADEVIGKSFWETHWWNFSPESSRRLEESIARARNGETIREDVQVRMTGDKVIYIDFLLAPMRDQSGTITHLIASGVDISDRKRAQAELAEREQHYRQLIEGLPMMSWSCTPEGDCDFLNRGWSEYTGRPMVELLGTGWIESVHPDDRQKVGVEWSRSVRTGDPLMVEFRIKRHDETYRTFDTRAVPIRDAAGKISKWFGTNFDIEDRRRAEQRFRRLYESNLLGIVFYDFEGRLSDPNDAFLSLLGRKRDELDGLNWRTLTPPEWANVDAEQWARINADGKCGPFEKEFYRADGSRVSVLINAADIDPGKHDHGVAFVVDMTPVKRVEEALRRTEADLRIVNESLEQRIRERTAELQLRSDQLRALALDLTETESRERKRLAQVLHDHFQQLVSAAKLKVGIIRRRIKDEALLETVGQAESLLAETIDASRSLATELSPPVLHDGGLQAAFEWLARKMEKDHELFVTVKFDSGCEPDNEQVRIILFECARELLFNVVKHSGTNTAELAATMPQEGLLQITVQDEGSGFDPYKQDAISPKQDGTFGLLSIKERLGLLGGLMRIRSQPGAGTTVLLTVPVLPVIKEEPTPVVAAPQVELRPFTGDVPTIRVLVADDHRLFREGLISLITQEPYIEVVGQANDGEEAIELARQLEPDILLCDITMPKLNGIQVTAQLAREMPGIKIIGLSMHERDEMATAMRDAGAVAYCTKGGPTDVLLSVLRSVAASGVENSDTDDTDTDGRAVESNR